MTMTETTRVSVHAQVAATLNVVALTDELRGMIVSGLNHGWTANKIVAVAVAAARQTDPLESFRTAATAFRKPPTETQTNGRITLVDAIEHAQRNKTTAEQTIIQGLGEENPAAFCSVIERLAGQTLKLSTIKRELSLECERLGYTPAICGRCNNERFIETNSDRLARCPECNSQ